MKNVNVTILIIVLIVIVAFGTKQNLVLSEPKVPTQIDIKRICGNTPIESFNKAKEYVMRNTSNGWSLKSLNVSGDNEYCFITVMEKY